jgi:hypothetical protein
LNQCKRALFEAALNRGKVQLTVVAIPGLIVPDAVRIDGVVLEYGDNLAKPIPDLEASDDGVSATLPFHGKAEKTFVPWPAVVKMTQEGGFVSLWPIEVEKLRRPKKAVA